jgi:hypothetical protein
MTDPLPRRDFTHLPPPPEGPTGAVRGGRAIRRRRRAAGGGAAALSMALVAGVVIATGSGTNHASDQLVPAVPTLRHLTSTPGPQDRDRAQAAPTAGATRPVAAGPQATPTTTAAPGRPSPAATTRSGGTSASGYRTPPLTRTYAAPIPTGARFCEASVTTDSQGTRKRIDWCITPKVTTSATGHDLTVVVCRDQTTDSTLSFGRSLEADLAVVHNGRTVWRWSAGHPSVQQAHALSTPAGACWSWTTAWTDVDGTGRALPSGSYDLVVVSLADQVAELPDERTTFRIS